MTEQHLPLDRSDGRRRHSIRRWSGIVVVVTGVVGSAVGTGALALAAGPVHLGSAAASRSPTPAAIHMKVPKPRWNSAGTIPRMGGPVVASTGPAPARAVHHAGRSGSRSVARHIAHHLAAGNTEVARYVIPYEVYRITGCRIGFMSATVDPSQEGAVRGEKQKRGSRLARARRMLGREAVAHAAEPTVEGLKVHVIVAQLCPVRRGT